MNVLELYAGSRSIGNAAEELGMTVFSSDINNYKGIKYIIDIMKFDVTVVPFIPDIIWASPPCTFFSVASISTHWNRDNTPKSKNALVGVAYVVKTLEIIYYFLSINPKMHWYMENPTGKLRKLPIVRGDFDRATITYCKYGDNRMKPTDIWSNNIFNPMFNPSGWKPIERCNPGEPCHHELAPRGSKTGTQGRGGSFLRSKIPKELCLQILKSSIGI